MNDNDYMELALQLAKKGCGWTSPNPMVGAVIVKDGRIIGQGYHERYGDLHAERNALASCTESPKGAAIYVTLEPCCHQGKQPPCVDAILEAGISRVVIGSDDPNPLVAGKGIQILRSHGVSVTQHVLKDKCDRINDVFFYYIQTRLPYVAMKYAMTMDGKIATYTGASRWITGEASREHVHKLRHRYQGIMVGIGTVLADDPLLTCRMEGGRDPIRIICDSRLRTPLSSQIVRTARQIPTILATCCDDPARQSPYLEAGCEILVIPSDSASGRSSKASEAFPQPGCPASPMGHIRLPELMRQLGARGMDSILLEGGASLNWAALESGIVNKVYTYIAPKVLGGASAKSPVGGTGFSLPDHAVPLKNSVITRLGDDFLIESEVS
ncbi:MAG: bifunctional diaminohydroxyphosphoribosylaminopyrimidine deaminase/5-amino-6-(5-phosphoribosylamino)uracil reductase RibD [Lachnospiraceae bacterium]|nr:bifunctional diaminohydroxyphosphoribosylaminopyrimidine deaminase/5-amino-6-(5-phosphoribosylamino)uracil reductase RibD [Lachnospiraceae bacterium]